MKIDYTYVHDKTCEFSKYLEDSLRITFSEQLFENLLSLCQDIAFHEHERHLTSRRSRAADVCVYCGQPIGFKTKTCASGGACTAASLTKR